MAAVRIIRVMRMKWRFATMKKCSIILSLSLLAFSLFSLTGVFAAEAPRIEKDDLKAKIGNPEVVIIDVRSYTDWLLSGEKIQGAVRENYRDFDAWSAKYPKDKTLVLYCA
jgi:predicted sulfurtransferase